MANAKLAGMPAMLPMDVWHNTLIYIFKLQTVVWKMTFSGVSGCHQVLAWEGSRGSEATPHEPFSAELLELDSP